MGEGIGVDSSKIVDVDRRPDRCPGGTPAPPGERGREPPSFLFFLGLPLRWEESSPSGPWSPMAVEGREPLRDSISLSVLFCFSFPRSGRKLFLIFGEIRNSDCAEILKRFFSGYKLPCARSRAPTDVRGGHNPPPRARGLWRALVSCGLCGPPFAVIPTPKNHIYSKIILRKILFHLDFV